LRKEPKPTFLEKRPNPIHCDASSLLLCPLELDRPSDPTQQGELDYDYDQVRLLAFTGLDWGTWKEAEAEVRERRAGI